MTATIRRVWARLQDEAVGRGDHYWYLALQNASHYQDMYPLVQRFARGALLDLGAGRLYAREMLKEACATYTSCDIDQTHLEIDVVCDITRQLPFESESFDSLYCCSVLEHTRQPWNALAEMHRILRPGGVVILSVPFVFYGHAEPQDYFRFTRHGVELLAREAGFEIEELHSHGGLFHTVLNVGSILTSVGFGALRLELLIRPTTRVWSALARGLDRALDPDGRFANAIIAVLRK